MRDKLEQLAIGAGLAAAAVAVGYYWCAISIGPAAHPADPRTSASTVERLQRERAEAEMECARKLQSMQDDLKRRGALIDRTIDGCLARLPQWRPEP